MSSSWTWEDKLGPQALCLQPAGHPNHGQLHYIGGGALDGHVQGHPLPEGPEVVVGGLELRQPPAAAHQGGHVPVLLGLGLDVLHVLPHPGEGGQVLVHIVGGLLPADPDVLGQGEVGDAVDDAEVHRLGPAAQLPGDLLRGQAEDLAGGLGVNVLAGLEGSDHLLVPCHVGQQPQLDLGVVRVHQHPGRAGR